MSDKMDWNQKLVYPFRYEKKERKFGVKNGDHAELALYRWLNVACNCPTTPEEALKDLKEDMDIQMEMDEDEEPGSLWADIKERSPSLTLRALFKWWIPRLIKDGWLKPVDYEDGHCDECEEEEARKQPEPPKPEPPKKRTFRVKKEEGYMAKALREKEEERASSTEDQQSPS
jgi:hypothetical protein